MREAIAGRLVGTKVRRVEDPRLLTGTGRYVDDVTVPGMLHATFVRSPTAHALIRGIDVDAARRHPGRGRACTPAPTCRRSRTRSWGCCRSPVSTTRCTTRSRSTACASSAIRSRSIVADVALRRGGRRAARGGRLRGAGADRHHRARARSVAAGDLACAGGNVLQRDHRDYGDVDGAFARRRPGGARAVRAAPLLEPADGDAWVRRRGRPGGGHACSTTPATQNTQLLKWSLGRAHRSATGLAVAGRDRAPARADGGAREAGEGARRGEQGRDRPRREPAPASRSRSARACPHRSRRARTMAQTFLREPIRLVHLTRMLLGLLARDPVDAAARHRAGHRRCVRRRRCSRPARTSRCSRPRSTWGARSSGSRTATSTC